MWPERGDIVFDNVQLRYHKDLLLILYGSTMLIEPGESVGTVGHT